jgi:hypothetical protein
MKDRDLTPVLVWIPLVTQELACEFPVSTKQVVYAGARDQKITAWSVDWSPLLKGFVRSVRPLTEN